MLDKDEEESIRRCAATTVANLSGSEDFDKQIILNGGDKSLFQLVETFSPKKGETISVDRTEVIREAARALSKLSKYFKFTKTGLFPRK